MWHANKSQWRIVWTTAIAITILAAVDIRNDGSNLGRFLFVLAMDGLVLIWKFQKRGEP